MPPEPHEKGDAREALGIEPVRLSLTGHDLFLDFRYRVTDAEKAKYILRRTTTDIGLVDQESGGEVDVFQGVGKVGRLKQSTYAPEVGRIYSMMFRNPGIFHRGDLVTLRVGDLRVEDLEVR